MLKLEGLLIVILLFSNGFLFVVYINVWYYSRFRFQVFPLCFVTFIHFLDYFVLQPSIVLDFLVMLAGILATLVLDFIFPMNDVKIVPNSKNKFRVGIQYYGINRSQNQVMCRIYYPTQVDEQKLTQYYAHTEVIPIHIKTFMWPKYFTLFIQELKLRVSPGAVDKKNGPYPLVIFSHGINGLPDNYSKYCLELCSRGTIVISLEHCDHSCTYTKLPNGEEIYYDNIDYKSVKHGKLDVIKQKLQQRSEEISATIDEMSDINDGVILHPLNGLIDMSNIHITGHSFGGTTAYYSSIMDQRITSSSSMDIWCLPLHNTNNNNNNNYINSVNNNISYKPQLYFISDFVTRHPAGSEVLKLYHCSNKDSICYHCENTENLSYTDCSILCPFISRMMKYHGSCDGTYLVESIAEITYNFMCNQKIQKYDGFVPLA